MTTAITCPTYCRRVHNEQPDEVIQHESAPVFIEQTPAPHRGRPVLVQTSQDNDNMQPRLHVGGYDFDVHGARNLLAELQLLVQVMNEAQARLDLDLTTAGR